MAIFFFSVYQNPLSPDIRNFSRSIKRRLFTQEYERWMAF
jgi:hypothetical protein